MEKIFSYVDYRKFLKERFAYLKKRCRGVTHRSLSKKGGFASPNFLKLVMEGQRNLTAKSIPKVSHAFDLQEKEADFFEELVHFNQAKTVEEKDLAYDRLKQLRRDLPLKRVEHTQFNYFDRWYAVAIRELIGLKNFKEDPNWICARLKNKITPTQAKKTLKLLEQLRLIKRDKKGKLKNKQPPLSTGDEVSDVAIYRFHKAMIKKAQEALSETASADRDISSLTFSISKENFKTIKKRVQQFRKEILTLANSCNDPQAVYQFNIQFFNLSEILWEKS